MLIKNTIKPSSFEELPVCLQERFLQDCDLDYDPYESSKVEEIEAILCVECLEEAVLLG